jgi:hypothetical protein
MWVYAVRSPACTNIVEDYHAFVDWLFFGKQGVITDNDPGGAGEATEISGPGG